MTMHVMYNIVSTLIDVAYKIWTFLKSNYLKYVKQWKIHLIKQWVCPKVFK